MSDITITLDLSKERAALNAARVYLQARGVEGLPVGHDEATLKEVAAKVNELHASPEHTETYTAGIDFVAYDPSLGLEESRRQARLRLAKRGYAVRAVLIERLSEEGQEAAEKQGVA